MSLSMLYMALILIDNQTELMHSKKICTAATTAAAFKGSTDKQASFAGELWDVG